MGCLSSHQLFLRISLLPDDFQINTKINKYIFLFIFYFVLFYVLLSSLPISSTCWSALFTFHLNLICLKISLPLFISYNFGAWFSTPWECCHLKLSFSKMIFLETQKSSHRKKGHFKGLFFHQISFLSTLKKVTSRK